MHRSKHAWVAASIVPLGDDRYEARGCGPVEHYRCRATGDRVTCETGAE